jgi:hypothetical protein
VLPQRLLLWVRGLYNEAMVRYAGVRVLYTVSGSPVHYVALRPGQVEHRAAHERVLDALTTSGGIETPVVRLAHSGGPPLSSSGVR